MSTYFHTECHNNHLNFIINAALHLWHTVAIFEEHGDSKLHSHATHRISWQIKMDKEHLTKTFCKVPQIFILLSPVITINPERWKSKVKSTGLAKRRQVVILKEGQHRMTNQRMRPQQDNSCSILL